jgi:hypothetical protein
MKKFFIAAIAISLIAFVACNNNKQPNANNNTGSNDTAQSNTQTANPETKNTNAISQIIAGYLQIKNALTNDNGTDAANGGKALADALAKVDEGSFSDEQKKTYDDMKDDLKENAEHIGENANKIAHQREHFEMLSDDMYDLVKKFNGQQNLYRDFCPMYNNKKGAYWISETKEIKNPYL